MEDQFNWGFEDELGGKNQFVKKHAASDAIIDFSDQMKVDELMRFEIVKSLNFKVPRPGENIFAITTKAISLMDVMNYIENEIGKISEAIVFFYTINDKAARYICELSKRANLKIIISDLMNSQRQKERVITQIFDENNVNIVFCHNHSKIASFKIGENYFTLTGSMNAGNNARIESIEIMNSKKMYDFINQTFTVFSEKFSINKRYAES
ncbi:MAG: hypothetical protein EOM44_12980 [Bacteroidia bacterium]|nr:hypothetical protein [Bacteroidia bacterium]